MMETSCRTTDEVYIPGSMPVALLETRMEEIPLRAVLRSIGSLRESPPELARAVADRLADERAILDAGVHPVELIAALRAYLDERGPHGRGLGRPDAGVVEALDAAFYLAMENVRPTTRRTLVALDVSGSMASPARGMGPLSCREAAATMALVAAATEPEHRFVAFAAEPSSRWIPRWRRGMCPLVISPVQRLEEVVHLTGWLPFGGTDCALPMLEAARRRWSVDVFVVYTDRETGVGDVHPAEALRRYRERTGIEARLVVVAMASRGFRIADPADRGMLDLVGFDAETPRAIREFSA